MLVRSQDGEFLGEISALNVQTDGKIKGIFSSNERDYYFLGGYSTEKRAKEVIDDIVAYISNYGDRKSFVYRMPKE